MPIRWVFVHDVQGTHEDRYFYSTDPSMDPARIITLYTGRWSIEVTFQEAKQHRGLATPRNRKRARVLRTAPCLLGCFSLVTLLFHRQPRGTAPPRPAAYPWYVKHDVTFSDALTAVRRLLWKEAVLSQPRHDSPLNKLPFKLRDTLLEHLSRAA